MGILIGVREGDWEGVVRDIERKFGEGGVLEVK